MATDKCLNCRAEGFRLIDGLCDDCHKWARETHFTNAHIAKIMAEEHDRLMGEMGDMAVELRQRQEGLFVEGDTTHPPGSLALIWTRVNREKNEERE